MCLKCESGSSRFQPGEGPSRGLLRDYEPSDGTFWSTSPDPDDEVGGHQVRHQEVGQPLAVEDVQPGVDQNCGSLK